MYPVFTQSGGRIEEGGAWKIGLVLVLDNGGGTSAILNIRNEEREWAS
jgi:hypothetical protein